MRFCTVQALESRWELTWVFPDDTRARCPGGSRHFPDPPLQLLSQEQISGFHFLHNHDISGPVAWFVSSSSNQILVGDLLLIFSVGCRFCEQDRMLLVCYIHYPQSVAKIRSRDPLNRTSERLHLGYGLWISPGGGPMYV